VLEGHSTDAAGLATETSVFSSLVSINFDIMSICTVLFYGDIVELTSTAAVGTHTLNKLVSHGKNRIAGS